MKSYSQDWLIAAGAYPGFCSMKRLEVFLLPLDGMLVHRRSLSRRLSGFPNIAGTHLHTWVESKVSCPRTQHNTMSPARARTQTALSGDVERTNHEVTVPPTISMMVTICVKHLCNSLQCNIMAPLAKKLFLKRTIFFFILMLKIYGLRDAGLGFRSHLQYGNVIL